MFFVDAHCDTLLDLVDGRRDFSRDNKCGHLDLPKLQAAGVRLQFLAAFIETKYKPEMALKRALQLTHGLHKLLNIYEKDISLITGRAQLDQLQTDGSKIGILFSIEGGEAIAGELHLLELFYLLGLRALTLTWNHRNELGDGVGEGDNAGGLSKLGKSVVQRMNELGMVVDVSHLSDAGFWDVIDCTSQPVIASHSNSRTICPHRRNLSDDQIRALASSGGVVGITFAGEFIDVQNPTLAKLLDHVVHIASLVGTEHIGIGSDFDGVETLPHELPNAGSLPALTEAMSRRGFSNQEIMGMAGGNLLRVLNQVLK